MGNTGFVGASRPATIVSFVDGILGEEAFNKAYLELITSKFGDVDGFASRYPLGGYFQFVE